MVLNLGPIVGHVTSSSARIWARLTAPGSSRLRLFQGTDRGREVGSGFSAKAKESMGNALVFDVAGLEAETRYFYDVENGDGISLLPRERSDLSFKTAPAESTRTSLKFGLISCNNPRVGPVATRFDVWKRMKTVFAEQDVRFLILAGDQLYADDAYHESAKRRRPRHGDVVAGYRRQYERQWSKPEIMDVLGRVPSYMIWDDHEIRNGWGSFRRDTSTPKRQAIFRGARQAYAEFQHAHGPQTFGKDRFYYGFRFGSLGVFMLDMRGLRDCRRKRNPLLSARQLRDFKAWVKGELEGLSALAVVSSVPVAHAPTFISNLIPRSDLRDQWSYQPNKPERDSVVRFLFDVANQQDIPVTLLSGDVHVATTARLRSRRAGHQKRPKVYQFTSSPVTNRPSRIVGRLLLAKDRVRQIGDGIEGQILDICTRRNFGIVEMNQGVQGGAVEVRFALYEEGRDKPHIFSC